MQRKGLQNLENRRNLIITRFSLFSFDFFNWFRQSRSFTKWTFCISWYDIKLNMINVTLVLGYSRGSWDRYQCIWLPLLNIGVNSKTKLACIFRISQSMSITLMVNKWLILTKQITFLNLIDSATMLPLHVKYEVTFSMQHVLFFVILFNQFHFFYATHFLIILIKIFFILIFIRYLNILIV